MSNAIRAVVLAFLVCTGQAARGADEVRAAFTSQARFADADHIEVRMAGGNAVLARLGVGPGLVRTLGAAWLSSSREFMSVAGSRNGDGSFEAVCADSRAVESRLGLLGGQVMEFGAPVLLVEAERPENAGDQRAAAQLQQGLAELGIVAVDAEAARARRRSLADAAVKDGMDAEAGRAAIDRPDVDFVLRVRWSKRDEPDGASYGISLSSCEITIASTLLRIGNQSSVPVRPGIGTARSRSPRAADIEAERMAVDGAVLGVAAVVSAEWMALAADERPWIIEVQAPNGVDLAAIAGTARSGDVVVLEDRPGIGALINVPGGVARQIESGPAVGAVLLHRPGFILISGGRARPEMGAAWLFGGIGLLAVVGAGGAIAWRRRHPSRRRVAPGAP